VTRILLLLALALVILLLAAGGWGLKLLGVTRTADLTRDLVTI
jgi:hypothetical protein